jgi:type IV secretion system protein VirD4
MKERYGATVLKDIAAGRTEALAKDVPDPALGQAMALPSSRLPKNIPRLVSAPMKPRQRNAEWWLKRRRGRLNTRGHMLMIAIRTGSFDHATHCAAASPWLTSGLLVGLIAGGLVLNLILGRDPNATGIFVLIAEFPGFARLTSVPWVLPWQIVGASTVIFTIAAVALTFRQQLTEYGQAKFQARAEMKANGLLQPLGAGMVFGKLGAPSKRAPYVSATFQKFPHCLVVAPTRAGKGVGYVIPNTLLFNGSIVVLDVKGEIFEATSRHRQAEGDAVYRFSPFDFEHPTHRYNPLERVARIENLEQRYTELAKISDYFLTVSDKGTAGDFLTEGRELFVAAGLLAIERGKPTIGEISRILFGRGATQEVYGEHAEEVKHPNAAQTFRKFAGYSDRTLSSHASVLGGAGMTLWNNPAVDRATSGNDFSFADLRKRPMSIYVVVNADDIRTLSPWCGSSSASSSPPCAPPSPTRNPSPGPSWSCSTNSTSLGRCPSSSRP